MKKALLFTLLFLALQLVSSMAVGLGYALISHDLSGAVPVEVNIITMVVFSVLTLVVFLCTRWVSVSRHYVRSRPWAVLTWSALAAVGALVPSMMLQSLLPEWSGWAKEVADQTNAELVGLMQSPCGYLVVALLPPVVEELVFRGAILKSLLQWKPKRRWLMIVGSAMLFAAVHINPDQMLHAFLIGILLGWLYERTGSVVPGVAYHWVNNTLAYVLFHLYRNPDSLQDIVGPDVKQQLLALLFSLCILVPALLQLNQRMKRA